MAQIYKNITADDRSFISQESTTGLWSADTGSLNKFYTSTTQLAKANFKYFVDVYNADPATTASAEVQFSIGYGNRFGSGSPTLTQENTSTRSTQAVYLQLKNLLLDPTDTQFTFAGSATSDSIYAVVVARARYKGYVDSGNWQLTLSGSRGEFHFIDDSSQTLGTKRSFAKNGLVFNVASGSLTGTQGSTVVSTTSNFAPNSGKGFGLFYPQKGIIIFNADVLTTHVGFVQRTGAVDSIDFNASGGTAAGESARTATAFMAVFDTGSGTNVGTMPIAPFTGSLVGSGGTQYEQYNWHGLYRSMVLGAGSGDGTAADNTSPFKARSAEIISSNHYFLRLNNKEFNYSNNPSFATGSNGQLANQDFENDPKVFVTTVGLYNDSNELLAVAKLSRPLEKSFSKEALLRVRLDF
tara:strand:- start:129 stop:1361 length:1233 start_codon:yes stop_codon:yes gene_type:complete